MGSTLLWAEKGDEFIYLREESITLRQLEQLPRFFSFKTKPEDVGPINRIIQSSGSLKRQLFSSYRSLYLGTPKAFSVPRTISCLTLSGKAQVRRTGIYVKREQKP